MTLERQSRFFAFTLYSVNFVRNNLRIATQVLTGIRHFMFEH